MDMDWAKKHKRHTKNHMTLGCCRWGTSPPVPAWVQNGGILCTYAGHKEAKAFHVDIAGMVVKTIPMANMEMVLW